MTETRRFWARDPEVAGNPSAEMSRIGSNHAILWQNIVHRLAQRARVDVAVVRFIRMRTVTIVAGTDALARNIVAATQFSGRRTPLAELAQERLSRRFRVAKHGVLHRHLITQLWCLDIYLRDSCTWSNQFALFGGPLRETHAKAEDEIASGDHLIRGRRGKATADANRPLIVRKQTVAANRRREQRAHGIGKSNQCLFRVRQNGTPSRENKWSL